MDKRLRELISITRKAGCCIIGQDNLKNYKKKLYLVLLDESAGNSLSREMHFLADQKQIPIITVNDLEQSSGIDKCKVIGIDNKKLSEKIEKYFKGE